MWTNWILRHRRLVMVVWLMVTVVGGLLAPRTIDRLSYDFSFPGQPAYEANTQIQARFGNGGSVDPLVVVVTLPAGRTVDDPAVRAELAAAYGRLDRPGWRVASILESGDGGAALVSADRHTVYALVYPPITPGPDPYAAAVPQIDGALAGTRIAGAPVRLTGVDPLTDSGGGSDRPIIVEIALGAGGALVVLVLAFGSLLAAVPLLLAAAAITTTFLLVLALTAGLDVSFIIQYLVGLIGLGVAIDYALLIVMRWREERDRGADNHDAVRTAMGTAGRAVVFSGVTVAISLLGLVVLPLPFLRSVGLGGLLIPLVSVLIAVTLLPAILAAVGPRLEWPRKRIPATDGRAWHAIGRAVVRHRLVAALLAVAALAVMAAPVFGLRLGSPQIAAIAGGDSPAATGYRALATAGFSPGVLRPVEVLTADDAATAERLRTVSGVAAVLTPESPAWRDGDRQVVAVVLATDPATAAGRTTVRAVREAAAGVPDTVVGGTAAQDADAVTAIYGDAGWVLALVVLITFLLLARALRSIWLPVKALLLNILSIGAAYGLTVLVWQRGWGSSLLFGVEQSGAITVWVPIAAFSFLFGLSMDYEVFILSRIREGHDEGMSTDEATVHGIGRTGRLVTSAALILFLAFVALSTVPVVDVKIFATTLALGIALDATIVRGVLTPALVALFGQVNWWWPRRPRRRA